QNGRARPGSIPRRPGGENGKERAERDAGHRRSGPDAEPDELPSQSVLFDSRSQACLSEHAAPNLEVPAIEVAASEDTETFRSQRRLDRLKPLARRPPLLAPDGEGARPGKRESERSAPPPGSEPRGKATVQARQRQAQ